MTRTILHTLAAAATLPLLSQAASYAQSSKSSALTRLRGVKQPSAKYLQDSSQIGQAELYSLDFDSSFATNLTVGGQNVTVIVDTGSSDTWVADSSYTCVNITNNATLPQADCGLVASYSLTSSFQEISNENFNISYGDGEYLNGVFGYETLVLAGIEVTHQQIGVPYLAGWEGNNVTGGLTGLAYPAITSAFAGTNVSADNFTDPNSAEHYSPVINTIFFVENLTDPVFSLSINRNDTLFGFGGYLTIGGIPDITDPTVNASEVLAVTPIEYLSAGGETSDVFTFYTITVEELVYETSPGPNATQFIVDSGTTLNYFPTADADAFNALWDPPAVYNSSFGLYTVPCNATPPELGVVIGGEVFYHNPADLIYELGVPGLPNLCGSGIADGGDVGPLILGDVFLKNVLAVFDVGESLMGFSSRMYYETSGGD